MTATSPLALATNPTAEPIRPLRLGTLLAVELRKMTDTRSARGVLAATLGLVVSALVWELTHLGDATATFGGFVSAPVDIVAVFGPVLGLLAMTSEWTQRTALTTFTLAPRRLPVIAAKYASSVVVSLGVLTAALALTALATAGGGAFGEGTSFTGFGDDVRGAYIVVVLQVTMAAAFGALIPQTAGALTAYFVAPIAWDAAAQSVLGRAAPWFDVYTAYERLSTDDPWRHLGWTLTSVATFVVVPAVIGVVRSLRREVK